MNQSFSVTPLMTLSLKQTTGQHMCKYFVRINILKQYIQKCTIYTLYVFIYFLVRGHCQTLCLKVVVLGSIPI